MSESGAVELTAAAIISQIEEGGVPREALLSFAHGLLPLERDEVISVIAYLAAHPDEEIAGRAAASLAEFPTRIVSALAANEEVPSATLERLAEATRDDAVLEALIRNRSFPDEAVLALARGAAASTQEVIVVNQARILRSPEILDVLLENPRLTPDVRRRALETREEFFDKKSRARLVEISIAEELATGALDAIADLLEAAAREPEGAASDDLLTRIPESERSDSKKQALFARILNMSVAEKVLLGFRGDRTARLILVRERNRLVSAAAIRNPRITDAEVESIAGMRNVEEEVLRIIGMRRDWMAKYPIILALARNPKAPVGVVLTLINRLTLRDLKGLKDDKGVSDAARSAARRAYQARTQKS